MKFTKLFFLSIMPFISVCSIAAFLFVQLNGKKENFSSLPSWAQTLYVSISKIEAELGYAPAQINLGILYIDGAKNVKQNPKQALYWLEKLANQGNNQAAYALAQLYHSGEFFSRDEKQTVYWLKRAIDLGNIDAISDLGICYSEGRGVEKNPQKALELYKLGAEKGDSTAMYNVGLEYSHLDHDQLKAVQINYEIAAKWYNQSFETHPNLCAANDLGILYATGRGVQQNKEKAKDFFKKALQNLYGEDKAPNLVNAFIQYQYYSLALNENAQVAMKGFSADEIEFAKSASQELVNKCWQ